MNGKNDFALTIKLSDLVHILNKYQEVPISKEHIRLDYETMQLVLALEALRLYHEDRMILPSYKVVLDER